MNITQPIADMYPVVTIAAQMLIMKGSSSVVAPHHSIETEALLQADRGMLREAGADKVLSQACESNFRLTTLGGGVRDVIRRWQNRYGKEYEMSVT